MANLKGRKRSSQATRKVAKQSNNTNLSNRTGAHARLSRPATDYVRSLVNPFDGPICSYPDLPIIRTRKERFWIKGTGYTNGSGQGYAMFNPFSGIAGDRNCCFVSSSTSTESGAFPASISATGCTGSASNSTHVSSSFTSQGKGYRVVSAGLRVRYTGQVLLRSGTYTAIHEPSHQGLTGKTVAQVLAYPEAKKVSIQDHKDWFGCTYMPCDLGDTKFINKYATSIIAPAVKAWWADSLEVQYEDYPFMGVIISTSAGASVSFDFEVAVNVEIIGPDITGKTVSLSDPVGLSAAHTAAAAHPQTMIHHGGNSENHAIHGTLNTLAEIVSTIGQGIHSFSNSGAVQQIGYKPKDNTGGSTFWDTLSTVWKGISAVAPVLGSILL